MNIAKLKAWLCLKCAPELSLRNTLELLKSHPDPLDYVGQSSHQLYNDFALYDSTKEHLCQALLPPNTQLILELMDRHGINYHCFSDVDYPANLKEIFAPPLILYYRGDLAKALRNPCLAVVGTRKPSTYGIEMCRKLLSPVCEKGVTIVSGLAFGIDTAAHHTALSARSQTIAVLASGLESIYPPANLELAERIANNGALVSEFEPGSKMERWNFPNRNRIISALSQAVFIVEGPENSGAMLTAKFAQEQKRAIFALPGNINNRNAKGPNSLIQNGASLISEIGDLQKLLGLDSNCNEQMEIVPELSPEEQSVFDKLANAGKELSFDEFILSTGFSFGKLSIVLLNLELKGLIAKSSGNSFVTV